MKFWQIAAAVLIFKLFDGSFAFVASVTDNKVPIVTLLGAVVVWLIASYLIWGAFREASGVTDKLPSRNG